MNIFFTSFMFKITDYSQMPRHFQKMPKNKYWLVIIHLFDFKDKKNQKLFSLQGYKQTYAKIL